MDGVGVEESRMEEPAVAYPVQYFDLQGNPLRGYIAITRFGQKLGLVYAGSTYDATIRFVETASGPTVQLWEAEGALWQMLDGGEVPAYKPWAPVEPTSFLGRLWAKISSRLTDLTR